MNELDTITEQDFLEYFERINNDSVYMELLNNETSSLPTEEDDNYFISPVDESIPTSLHYHMFMGEITQEDSSSDDGGLERIMNELTYDSCDFKVGDIGKIVLFYDYDSNTVKTNISVFDNIKIQIPGSALREIFDSGPFIGDYGLHRDINRPDRSQVLGGGAYHVLSNEEVFVDYESKGFGRMNKDLLQKCLQSKGYILQTLDDIYFDEEDKLTFYIETFALNKK